MSNFNNPIKRAILATGGMDSTVLLYKSVFHDCIIPTLITVDYGHAAFAKQLEFLNFHRGRLGIKEEVVVIQTHYHHAKPGLFTGTEPGSDADNPMSPALFEHQDMRYADTFIEGRNLIMVAHAMAHCSANKIDELQVGYLRGHQEWSNQRSYKMFTGDNSPQFVDMMNLLAFTGFSHQVRIRAPFYEQRMDKNDVALLGLDLEVDFTKTNSCYWPEPCGKCDNCILRGNALKFAEDTRKGLQVRPDTKRRLDLHEQGVFPVPMDCGESRS